jgi:hypothetical protein
MLRTTQEKLGGSGGVGAIGDTITDGTQGSVLFLGPSGVLAQDNANLFYDASNHRLGIGTASPATLLDINGVTTFRGNILAGTDNTYDIGASGTTRPRTGYFGTSIQTPMIQSGSGAALIGFGGVTSSFPALKRSSVTLEVKLADDSAYAPITASKFSVPSAFDLDKNGGESRFMATSGQQVLLAGATDAGGGGVRMYPNYGTSGSVAYVNDSGYVKTDYYTAGAGLVGTLGISGTDGFYLRAGNGSVGKIQTGQNAADTFLFQARDVDGGAYTTFLTLTANNTPSLTVNNLLTMADGVNIALNTTTGTKIGTATTQKLGFFNATPVVQPSAYTPSNVTTDRSYDANATTIDELADVLGTLISDIKSLGLIG